jgi:hypothetical protein
MRLKAVSRPLTFRAMQTTEVVGLGFYGEIARDGRIVDAGHRLCGGSQRPTRHEESPVF